jgi:hypothetical protein
MSTANGVERGDAEDEFGVFFSINAKERVAYISSFQNTK